MKKEDLEDLRAEFDEFVNRSCKSGDCSTNESGEKEDDVPAPQFVDALTNKLLAPAISGVYLSRLDIKRIAEAIGESLPIKERAKMVKALFRHTTKKEYLREAFGEINRHINGRILIYEELGETFVDAKPIFDSYTSKAKNIMNMFEQIIEDFEEIEPTEDPMMI